MPQSKIYKQLLSETKRLKNIYLNFQIKPTGDYNKKQLSMAAAHTIFCHAELEIFLERWCEKILSHAEAQWKKNKATRPLVHLCTFHKGRGAMNDLPKKDIWNEVVIEAVLQHKQVIKGNNGIKQSNICSLFIPLGFDVNKIDNLLLSDINSFGVLRGDYVHQSHQGHISIQFDPFDRQRKVEGIVFLLKQMDEDLLLYQKSA